MITSATHDSQFDALLQLVGTDLGHSDWLALTQDRVTAFGGVTLDFDPHHIDPLQAAHGPLKKAAAQGFLTLSLLTHFITTVPPQIRFSQNINYGLDKVRFIKPAFVGDRFRAKFRVNAVAPRAPNMCKLTLGVEVESEQAGYVVLAAEWHSILVF
jgi:acyl dehydratase